MRRLADLVLLCFSIGRVDLREARNGGVDFRFDLTLAAGSACAPTGTVTQNGHYLAAFE
jgi:hypothetical protein